MRRALRFLSLACAVVCVGGGCARTGTGGATVSGRHAWSVAHTLRFADVADPNTLNPYFSTMDLTYDVSSMVYSYLIISDASGHLIGDLASTVPTPRNGGISADGKTYVYHLRSGVKWHDGRPLTSADVRFSWLAVVNPKNSTLHREGYDRVSSIDAPDARTIIVHLKVRYPPFVTQFFAPLQEGGKPILPAHILAKYRSLDRVPFNAQPIGSGPFKFSRWERGRQIVLVRNDAYFKGRPKLSRVILSVIPNDNTMLDELRLHHIDLITAPTVALYGTYKKLPDAVVELYPWNAQSLFVLNNRSGGLRDVRVRRAIAMAIDYGAIWKKVTHGVGVAAVDIVPPTALGFTRNAPYRYDPASAKRLLDAGGWHAGADGVRTRRGERLDFTLDVIAGSSSQQMTAILMQQWFRAVGIHLSLKTYPYNSIFAIDGPIYRAKYDFAEYSVTLPWDPDNLFYLGCDYVYPKGENIYGYCNRTVDRYEQAGLTTEDARRRSRAYREAAPLIHATVPYVPLYQLRRLVVRSPDIKNFSANPTSTPWWNIWQWDV